MDENSLKNEEISVPKFGLKLKLNHVYPQKVHQSYTSTIIKLLFFRIGLVYRYAVRYIKCLWQGRKIVMDFYKPEVVKQIYGVPIGGIGAGTIGRGYRGEFCRFQLRPGIYEYNTVDSNQFIVTIKDEKNTTLFQSVLSTYQKTGTNLNSWKWLIDGENCHYTGLYPRAWTEYDLSQYGVKLICRQVSPVIPHNYQDSSLPCAMFIWNVENTSTEKRKVTISLTFKNGTGDKKRDSASKCQTKVASNTDIEGVILNHYINQTPCSYGIYSKPRNNLNVTKCLYFDPNSNGEAVWNQLNENGKFNDNTDGNNSIEGEMACAIASQIEIASLSIEQIEICLVWDMPVVHFANKRRNYNRYYTKFFKSDNVALEIADYSFKNYRNWDKDIYQWQSKILDDRELPDWYKSAIFNETYYVSDGGTVWFTPHHSEMDKLKEDDPRSKYGHFAYLEGHEYRMYNTYDVHFYASFALAINWPLLQLVLQYDIKDTIFTEINEEQQVLIGGHMVKRKVLNTVPHDIGDPEEEPFLMLNAYPVHDVSQWRDLNVKFVLQVLRDYNLAVKENKFNGKQYVEEMYEACKAVMEKSQKFDADGDGLIENSGISDQTFDVWTMTGPSAYCGGLWLAAVFAMTVFADVLKKDEDKKKFEKILEKGKKHFEEKLWNGKFYKFDSSQSEDIMADQLCGYWYLRSSGYTYEVYQKERVVSALKCIFENNVMSFYDGNLGARNGFPGNRYIAQSIEAWTGVTYALAANFLYEGMLKEGWQTAGGLFKSMSEQLGLAFETPEALYSFDYYRSGGYMRPLSIWSMQIAWENYKHK